MVKPKKSKRRERGVRGRGTVFERKTKTQGTKWITSISYVDWQGVRHRPQLTFATREQALSATKFLEAQRDRHAKISGSVMTLTQLTLQWMNNHDWDESTRYTYETLLNKHVLPFLGKRRLVELDPPMIETWRRVLRDAGTKPAALQRAWYCLSQALKYAIHPLQLIAMHPMSGLPAPQHRAKEICPFTPEEMTRIFEYLRGHYHEPLMKLIYLLGLRQGEAYGLKWSDFDPEKGTLTIQRQNVLFKGQKKIKDKAKTRAGMRVLELSENHLAVIQQRQQIAQREGHDESEFMFTTVRGESIDRSWIYRSLWKPLLAELGIAHRGLHHFRHTAATTLIEQGISITDVSGALGHSKPSFTMHAYVHNRKQKHGKAFGALTAVECDKKADRQCEGSLRDSETVDTVRDRQSVSTSKPRKPVQQSAKADLQMQKKEMRKTKQ
jgi:integrase